MKQILKDHKLWLETDGNEGTPWSITLILGETCTTAWQFPSSSFGYLPDKKKTEEDHHMTEREQLLKIKKNILVQLSEATHVKRTSVQLRDRAIAAYYASLIGEIRSDGMVLGAVPAAPTEYFDGKED